MVKAIIQLGDKRLNQASEPVAAAEWGGAELKQLITDLRDTASVPGLNSVGLSAVQIGVLKQVFVCKRIDENYSVADGQWEVFINAKLKVIDPQLSYMWEGCLSVGEGDKQLFAPLKRPRAVELEYLGEDGNERKLLAEDYFAHVIQHEVDHLNGILFLKYVKSPQLIWQSKELDKYIAKHGDYPPVPANL